MVAIRVKNQWFRPGVERSLADQAGVVAFTLWRAARAAVDALRKNQFEVDIGPGYFAVLQEVAIYAVWASDRIVSAHLDQAQRFEFTPALALHVADHMEENANEWLGIVAPGEPSWHERFVQTCNELAPLYADLDVGASEPGFAFNRLVGARVQAVMPESMDRFWVQDQLMEIELPEVVTLLKRSIKGVLDPGPRASRRARRSTGD